MAAASSCPNDGAASPKTLRERWREYKDVMLKNSSSETLKYILKHSLQHLVRLLRSQLNFELEYQFIDADSNCTAREVMDRLWDVLMFRPDVVRRAEQFLRSKELILEDAADLLREALSAAGWLDFDWSPPREFPSLNLWHCGDALAGLATVAHDDLARDKVITRTGAASVDKKTKFMDARGCELVRQLTWDDTTKLKEFCEKNKNNFLLLVFAEHWPGPPAVAPDIPALPDYFVERKLFPEAMEKLKEAFNSEDQVWLTLYGLGGAGKSTAALNLARQAPTDKVVWIPFGQKSLDEYQDAMNIIGQRFPTADSGESNAKNFLARTLTFHATKDAIIFIDDVCKPADLFPFAAAKTVVITSRDQIEYFKVKKTLTLEVSLSLTERESLEIMHKVFKMTLSDPEEEQVRAILESIHYNALATSAVASYIMVNKGDWSQYFFEDLKSDLERNAKRRFDIISGRLKTKSHDYMESGREHVNIYAILEVILDKLEKDLKEAFYCLIIFPRSSRITGKVFNKISNVEYLETLCEHSLLQRRGKSYTIHDLLIDTLEEKLPKGSSERRSYFQKLVENYESQSQMDSDDDYYYLHFIGACMEADRTDVAQRFLSSAKYLMMRFNRYRFLSLFRDFDALGDEASEDVKTARKLFMEPLLWHQGFGFNSLIRQVLFFSRNPQLESELVEMAQKEECLPLYRYQNHEIEEKVINFEEVARVDAEFGVEGLAINERSFSLVVAPPSKSGKLVLLDEKLSTLKSKSFAEWGYVHCVAPARHQHWLLVTSKGVFLFDSDLNKVAKWSSRGSVRKAAVDPLGNYAALCSGSRLLLIDTEGKEREIDSISNDYEVEDIAISCTVVAAVSKKKNSRSTELFIWNIKEEALERKELGESNFNLRCGFVSDDKLVLLMNRKLRLLNGRTGIPLGGELECGIMCDVKFFPVANAAAVLYLGCIRVVDENLSPIFSTSDFDSSTFSSLPIAVHNSSLIFGTVNHKLVHIRKCKKVASFPRIRPEKKQEFLGVVWLLDENDWAIFHKENIHIVLTTATNYSQILQLNVDGWTDLRLEECEDAAIIWEFCGHRLTLLSPPSIRTKDFHIEEIQEKIRAVARRDSRLAVGTDSGAVLLQEGGEWLSVAHQKERIRKVFLFERTVGCSAWKEFRIFDLSDKQLYLKEIVGSVQISPCGTRAAMVIKSETKYEILEVSQNGQELCKFDVQNFPNDIRLRYLPIGLLVWSFFRGFAFLMNEEKQREKKEFPNFVRDVLFANDGSFVVILTDEQLWIADLRSGRRELLLDRRICGAEELRRSLIYPDDRRVLVIASDSYSGSSVKKEFSFFVLDRLEQSCPP